MYFYPTTFSLVILHSNSSSDISSPRFSRIMRWIVASIFIQLFYSTLTDESLFPYVDRSVKPCDNFYKFACGNFEKIHPVPEEYTTWDSFIRLQKLVDERLKGLLEERNYDRNSKSFAKAKEMYASCMDTKTRDKRGIYPLYKILKGWPSNYDESTTSKITSNDWQKIAKFVANYGVQFIFKLTIRADLLEPERTAIYIERDELTLPTSLLPEPVRILDNDPSSRTDFTFVEYLIKIMIVMRDFDSSNLISDKELFTIAKNVNDFMIVLRDLTDLDYGEDTATNIPNFGPTTVAQLQAWTDEVLVNFNDPINWQSYLQTAFKKSGVKLSNDTNIFVTNRNLLRNILIYTHETEKNLLDNFVYSRMATFMAPELSSKLFQISMDFYTKRDYIPSSYPRWKYCLHKVLDFPKIGLSFAVAQVYRKKYVREETVKKARVMIENLRDALEELIEESYWMDDSTKNFAIDKLNNILILTGGPDYLNTEIEIDQYYRKLKIFENDHFGNMNRLRSFSQGKNFIELEFPRNRNLWTQSPLIVNAYYNGLNNRILFPISTMAEPFFTENATSFLDYAGIGSIMAHELTHAFDSQGKLLNAEGSIVDWWSDSTKEIYTNTTKCFVEQYNRYVIEGSNSNVDGEYTLPENIADNVGLRAAFRAFVKEREKLFYSNSESTNNYFVTNQAFYLAFASTWCHVGTTVHSDKHAPHKYRVLGPIQNMENFIETWHCKATNNKYKTHTVSFKNSDKHVCILW